MNQFIEVPDRFLTQRSAYFLIYHGSRDPRSERAALELRRHVSDCLTQRLSGHQLATQSPTHSGSRLHPRTPPVGVGALELAPIPLHEQLVQFSRRVQALGYTQLQIVPLFLLAGVHVREDIPVSIAKAQAVVGSSVQLVLCPYLGSHGGMIQYLRTIRHVQVSPSPDTVQILLSHGSRRPGGNQIVEAIADQLPAVLAYWSISPKLEDCLAVLDPHSVRKVVILPYFLFVGGITDAIAETVQHYRHRWPSVQVHLTPPLGAHGAIAERVADLALASAEPSTLTPTVYSNL